MRQTVGAFRSKAKLRSEGLAAPSFMPAAGLSDQWAFWQQSYLGLMVTDTAPFRNPEYHRGGDTPEKLYYPAMAQLVEGLEAAVQALASRP